jgi:hypothetical protein
MGDSAAYPDPVVTASKVSNESCREKRDPGFGDRGDGDDGFVVAPGVATKGVALDGLHDRDPGPERNRCRGLGQPACLSNAPISGGMPHSAPLPGT